MFLILYCKVFTYFAFPEKVRPILVTEQSMISKRTNAFNFKNSKPAKKTLRTEKSKAEVGHLLVYFSLTKKYENHNIFFLKN